MLRTVQVALRTLAKIDQAMRADQGASFRVWQGRVMPHMDDAYRGEDGGHRSHLGASILGGECPRSIWYSFRWVHKAAFEGRTLRLFNRGHLEEARFIALLLMIGCEVWQQDANGKQFRISWAEGHAGGSGDGVERGIPDLPPETAAVCEFKTHGEKSFIELAGKLNEWRAHVENPSHAPFTGQGVRSAKFEHYVQMQLYMRKMGLPAAIYMAVCKNTDDLYAEVIHLDHEFADQYLDRGEQIVWATQAPKRISESAGFYKCRWCDKRPVCHMGAAPDLNCRTCEHSEPVRGGEGAWHCRLHGMPLSKELQQAGCKTYKRDPAI